MPQHLTWEAIEAILRGAYRALLFGPPGTGKTRAAYEAAKTLGKSLYNITLSDETPAAELRGHYVPQGTKWIWMDGPAVRAFREGAMLCLDEIDKASQDCLDFLHGLLNDPEVSRLTLPSGEIVMPNPGFQVVATMNGAIEDLQPSLQDRFSIAIEVLDPHPNAIASLPQDLQGVAKKIESYEIQQRPATIRRWAAFGTLREIDGVGVENAAKAVFAHRATDLLDAIGFRSTLTDVAEAEADDEAEDEDEEEVCTCDDCRLNRARAWMYHHYETSELEEDSDGDYRCPSCSSYYTGSEEKAILCCYSDDEWLEDCRREGRSVVL